MEEEEEDDNEVHEVKYFSNSFVISFFSDVLSRTTAMVLLGTKLTQIAKKARTSADCELRCLTDFLVW